MNAGDINSHRLLQKLHSIQVHSVFSITNVEYQRIRVESDEVADEDEGVLGQGLEVVIAVWQRWFFAKADQRFVDLKTISFWCS